MKTRCDLVEQYEESIWNAYSNGLGVDGAPSPRIATKVLLHDLLMASDSAMHTGRDDLMKRLQPGIVKRKR